MLKILNLKDDAYHIYIYNDVDVNFGFSSQDLINELKEIPADAPITVHINSYGGDVFQGLAIYNLLNNRQNVTTVVEGIAASIASVIFLAGDVREMYPEAWIMAHSASIFAGGQQQDIKDALALVEQTDKQLFDIYKKKTGMSDHEITDMLAKDTYLTTTEAKAFGIATRIIESQSVTATANLTKLVASLSRRIDMKFETWLADYCKPLGLDASTLSDTQRTALKAQFDKIAAPQAAAIPVAQPVDKDAELKAQRERRAIEDDRVDSIQVTASRYVGVDLNADYLKNDLGLKTTTIRGLANHAVREGWSSDKFELEARRAEMPELGNVNIHIGQTQTQAFDDKDAVVCAMLNSVGVKHDYNDKVKEAADHKTLRNMGLHQIMNQIHVRAYGHGYGGRFSTDGFIDAIRNAMYKLRADGNTTWGGLNIFDDVANKMLLAAYNGVPTTWSRFVSKTSVNDFKTHNHYRLTVEGGYKKLAADGRLSHGGFSDERYQVSADTYGKIIGLNRKDLINDDLGALNRVMSSLGIEGARFLEELFWGHLLANLTTIFPTNDANANYISGAGTVLGVDGLSEGVEKFRNQTHDDAPILVNPDILLVGSGDEVVANELYRERSLQGVQTANAKRRPDNNPHTGLFEPTVSPFMNNTALKQRTDALDAVGQAFSNQSDTHWLLLASPSVGAGACVLGAFLNGVETPTISQSDQAFDVLGLQWRAYQDAGVASGDPKLGVYSKGAA